MLKTFQLKDLAGHGKEEAIEEEKKKKVKPDAASFPTEGKTEEEKKDNLFFFNETEFKDEKENSGVKGGASEQAGSLSNLLDLNNPQVRKGSFIRCIDDRPNYCGVRGDKVEQNQCFPSG